jgi:hypothetical protein
MRRTAFVLAVVLAGARPAAADPVTVNLSLTVSATEGAVEMFLGKPLSVGQAPSPV